MAHPYHIPGSRVSSTQRPPTCTKYTRSTCISHVHTPCDHRPSFAAACTAFRARPCSTTPRTWSPSVSAQSCQDSTAAPPGSPPRIRTFHFGRPPPGICPRSISSTTAPGWDYTWTWMLCHSLQSTSSRSTCCCSKSERSCHCNRTGCADPPHRHRHRHRRPPCARCGRTPNENLCFCSWARRRTLQDKTTRKISRRSTLRALGCVFRHNVRCTICLRCALERMVPLEVQRGSWRPILGSWRVGSCVGDGWGLRLVGVGWSGGGGCGAFEVGHLWGEGVGVLEC